RTHENAVHWTRIDAQRAEHALGVIDLETVDAKAFADGVLDFLDVDAVDRAGAGALVTADAGGQIEAMKPAIAGLHRYGQVGIFEMLGERLALVGLQEVPEGNPHSLSDRGDRDDDVPQPGPHTCFSPPVLRSARLSTANYMRRQGCRKMASEGQR